MIAMKTLTPREIRAVRIKLASNTLILVICSKSHCAIAFSRYLDLKPILSGRVLFFIPRHEGPVGMHTRHDIRQFSGVFRHTQWRPGGGDGSLQPGRRP